MNSKTRAFLKITFFCLIPSLALFAFARWLWPVLVERFGPSIIKAEEIAVVRDSPIPRNIAITGISASCALYVITLLSYFISPDFARKRQRPEMPALLRDLIRYGAFIFCVAVILHWVWGEGVAPVISALGIGGVVLGFALQETLSNFFAGLALLAEQPFRHGDWIKVGDKAEGTVEHITWRATKIRTRDSDYLIFPNSVVAKEVINNYRLPSRVHAIRVSVGTSYDDPPDAVKRALLDVLGAVPSVLKTPPPIVYLKEYAASSINYEVKCFIEDYDRRPVIEDEIMHRIWYMFRRRGIEIPFPIQTVFEYKMSGEDRPAKGKVDVPRVLGAVPIFAGLSAEEISKLGSGSRTIDFGGGEPVIRQGEPGETMYAIASGAAKVALKSEDGSERMVAQLQAGEFFGEMSLLTGDPRTATVYAGDGLVVVEVSKDALLPLLREKPAVAERIAELVTLRRQGLDKVQSQAAMDAGKKAEVAGATQTLLGRIRRFFRI